MDKYYCPFCKKSFEGWSLGHAGRNKVCSGGCNTGKDKMIKLQKELKKLKTW